MKKAILVALTTIVVCSVFLAGIVSAAKEGFGFQIATGEPVTFNGAVDPATEWDDSYKDFLYEGWTMTTNFFRCKWQGDPTEAWLIEILTDTTDDAGDNFKMCVDVPLEAGGTAPAADDFKVDWTGGTATLYQGTGSGWGTSSAAIGSDVIIASTVAASPASGTAHRIVELFLDKLTTLAMEFSNNMYMEYTDASTGQTFKWPPESNPDVPDGYGTGTTEFGDSIPEGLAIGVMLSLSTIAVLVSTRYFRKPRI